MQRHLLGLQIVVKQGELDTAQAGLRHLEHSLGQTHAGKQAERQAFSERVQHILSQKAQLEKQLHVQKARMADSQSNTVEAKMSVMNRRLAATQHQRALVERRLKDKQVGVYKAGCCACKAYPVKCP
jgi:chromosome segregation ATPase